MTKNVFFHFKLHKHFNFRVITQCVSECKNSEQEEFVF